MARRRRSSIDTELSQLTTELLSLQEKEDEFQRILDGLHKMKEEVTKGRRAAELKRRVLEAEKEPINWLPVELLVQIFMLATDADDHQHASSRYAQALSISHTCMKWRKIALATSYLWTRIVHHGFRRAQSKISHLYLERAQSAPLDIDYYSIAGTFPTDECVDTVAFLAKFKCRLPQIRSLSIHTLTAIAQSYLVPSLHDHLNCFPLLQKLTLAITTPNPIFCEVPSFLEREASILRKLNSMNPPEELVAPKKPTSCLTHLVLEQVPLFTLPVTLLSNIRVLELCHPHGKIDRHHYNLKMSSLHMFLSFTPLLEELTLDNTVPDFKGIPSNPGLVALNHLTTIDWTYPSPGDVQRFLSLFHLPALQKIELWTKERYLTHYEATDLLPERYTEDIVTLPALRDITLHSLADADLACRTLRKFNLPALERLELAYCPRQPSARAHQRTPSVESVSGEGDGGRQFKLPLFPRFDSLLRDPRLYHLTHLTLARYTLFSDDPEAEAYVNKATASGRPRSPVRGAGSLLGYLPALTSLSLDGCSGVNRLLGCLAETVEVGTVIVQPRTPSGVGTAQVLRAVRVCPRLAALSLWDCADADWGMLAKAVCVRNGLKVQAQAPGSGNRREDADADAEAEADGDGGRDASAAPSPEARAGVAAAAGEAAAQEMVVVVAGKGRKIKPLRKQRFHRTPDGVQARSDAGGEVGDPTGLGGGAGAPASTVLTVEEASRPARISFVRVVNCAMMEENAVLGLRNLGVVDVIWAGSGLG